MTNNFTKIIRLGRGKYGDVYAKIDWNNDRLSIVGVEGPLKSGNCRGGCGQISMSRPAIEHPATGWNQELIKAFWNIWDRWHLNDARAECEHQLQRGETWKTHPGAICPNCGYSLGSALLHEQVPDEVLEFFLELPETNKTPAWI